MPSSGRSPLTTIRQGPSSGRAEARAALTPAQWSIYSAGWDETSRFRVAVCGRRFGKALALDTPLPSPDGWTTMGAVAVGMRLYDEQGRICRIVFATEAMTGRPCNIVRFDDGSEVVADDDHVWAVLPTGGSQAMLRTTSEIGAELEDGPGYRIPSCRAIDMGVGDRPIRRRRLLRRFCRRHACRTAHGWQVTGSDRLLRRVQGLCLALGLVPRRSDDGQVLSWGVGRPFRWRRICAVVPVASRPVRCIQVDSPSRLFLCSERLIPTHNTFLMAEELRRAASLAVRRGIGTENEIWYGAPTFLQAKRVMWGRLKRTIPRGWIAGANETGCVLRLRSGHVIRLVGLDAAENLRGSGLWFFGGDEWADCRPSAWREVIRPMLSTSRGHALFIGTPKGFDHFRDAYLLGQFGGDPSYRSFLFTTEEGGNVPREEIEAAERELDPRSFRQEYRASFETYAGRVVYAFSRAENVRSSGHDPSRPLHVGMDFNVNPMSATVWQEDGETTRQIDEIVLPTSNTDELAEELARRYGRDGFGPGRKSVEHITIYPDPAGAQRRSSAGGRTDIGILRERGYVVCALRSHPPVRDRINVMNRHFRSADGRVLATVDPRCVRSIEAYERLVFREGTGEPDKLQGFDHLVDASGYYLFGRSGTRASASTSNFMER